MSDARLRELERHGHSAELLRERMRHGLLVPAYTSARELSCRDPICIKLGAHDENRCDGPIRPYDPWDLARLMSYLGDAAALELAGEQKPWAEATSLRAWGAATRGKHVPCLPNLSEWFTGLRGLATKLPPARVDVYCIDHPSPSYGIHLACNGKGWIRHDTSAAHYLLVVAALAVGQEARFELMREHGNPHGDLSGCPGGRVCSNLCAARDAFTACDAWIKCPCPDHARLVRERIPQDTAGMAYSNPDNEWWVRIACMVAHTPGHAAAGFVALARILTPDNVREISSKAILKVLNG